MTTDPADDPDGDWRITPEDYAEAERLHGGKKGLIEDLFARPVVGGGIRGDVLIGDDLPPDGAVCTAKRYGWDVDPDSDEAADRDPYEYASDDIEGELETYGDGPIKAYLVGGQEADPKTIREKPAA